LKYENVIEKNQKEMLNLAKRLNNIDRENVGLRRDKDMQKSLIERQLETMKDLRQTIQDLEKSRESKSKRQSSSKRKHKYSSQIQKSSEKPQNLKSNN
jgi:chromosome segregation ATPase